MPDVAQWFCVKHPQTMLIHVHPGRRHYCPICWREQWAGAIEAARHRRLIPAVNGEVSGAGQLR